MDVIYANITVKYRVCKNYIGCNIKKMYILVTILSTLRYFFFFVKDDQIKTITDLEGCNDDLS